ncbi:MAG: GNAT family protein [Thermomicrobiales bacterium]
MLVGERVTLRESSARISRASGHSTTISTSSWPEAGILRCPSLSNGSKPSSIGGLARAGETVPGSPSRVDGTFIGQCGLHNFNETSRTAELGIGIGDKDYWGRGYGREAVNLLVEYAFRYRNFRRVWLWVHADNERAIRAYLACGFVEEGRLREHMYSNGRYVDAVYMGILRAERSGDGT